MQAIDFRHLLDDTLSAPAAPRLRAAVRKIGEIISFATGAAAGRQALERPRCRRRPGRIPCTGRLEIGFDADDKRIFWRCPVCRDEGVISGWQNTFWDLSGFSGRTH